ncbi:hypothetical protein [Streptomyces avicenniae]|uniref:hypothetical protein n=1 Tax=Streptomyces avicenniae TaxID=500153 RepID=UPI00069AFA19|nr:hypothetical protein [Streptomyces avicenniae]
MTLGDETVTNTGHALTGPHSATTARLALRWLHVRAEHIAHQLDAPVACPVYGWIADHLAQERVLTALFLGETYAHTIHDGALTYVLTASPAPGSRSSRQAR